eukprot:9540621-Karenia_brevis.AAC.1
MSFEELARLTHTEVRAVQFELNEFDATLLRQIEDSRRLFNLSTEAPVMHTPIYGLKDTPRAWRKSFM